MSEAWIDDVIAGVDRRMAEGDAQPDFLDVVSRAHALDPEAFDESALEQAEALELAQAEGADELHDEAELDAWLGDVRAVIDRRVDERRQAPPPALVRAAPRRAIWWVGGAVAAGLLLALGIGGLMTTSSPSRIEALEQAVHISEPGHDSGGAVSPALPRSPAPPQGRVGTGPHEESDALPEAEVVAEPEVVDDEGLHDETDDEALAARRRARRVDRLAQLSEQAQEHWRAGRRTEAARLFGEVVQRGGRSRVAEMALADLFTLAYQLGDTNARRSHWRTYLRRFPRGRFADDARAGLCRTAASAKQGGCWEQYLRDFPRGSYRAEARVATEER